MSEEQTKTFLFRHKQIRRFAVAEFTFADFLLRLDSEEAATRFREIVAELPAREQHQIVEINEEAAAVAEIPVIGSTAIRGAMTAGDILTSKDKQRFAELQSKPAGEGGEPVNKAQPIGVAGMGALAAFKKP